MAFKRFSFTKRWTSAEDFPTVESDESRVRSDMQCLHDEAKDGINYLAQELEASTASGNIGATDREGHPSTLQTVLDNIFRLFMGIFKVDSAVLSDSEDALPTSKVVNDAIKEAGALPVGGSKGQVLAKSSNANYATTWQDSVRNGLNLVAKFTQAGPYVWDCPETGDYFVMIMGGGAGGCGRRIEDAIGRHKNILGGPSGFVRYHRIHANTGDSFNLVVGAGGRGGLDEYGVGITAPENGGASSFDGTVAAGGMVSAGYTGEVYLPTYANHGAQNVWPYSEVSPWGGHTINGTTDFTYYASSDAVLMLLPDEYGLPISCYCAGASAGQKGVVLPNGKKIPDSVLKAPAELEGSVLVCEPSTDCGAGGSCAAVMGDGAYERPLTVVGGDGADGGVFIYKLTGGDSH